MEKISRLWTNREIYGAILIVIFIHAHSYTHTHISTHISTDTYPHTL